MIETYLKRSSSSLCSRSSLAYALIKNHIFILNHLFNVLTKGGQHPKSFLFFKNNTLLSSAFLNKCLTSSRVLLENAMKPNTRINDSIIFNVKSC